MPREIHVDWGALAEAFSDDTAGVEWYLHVPTSQLLRVTVESVGPEDFSLEEGFLLIDRVRSRQQYRWMVRFIMELPDRELAAKLAQSIAGKQAFQRFRAALAGYPGRSVHWLDFRAEQLFQRMRHWLDVHDLTVARPRPTSQPADPNASLMSGRWAHLMGAIQGLPAHDLKDLIALAEFLRANACARAASQSGDVAEAARSLWVKPPPP